MLRIQLCGRFAVTVDGQRVDDRLPGRRGRALIAYLACHRESPVDRATLMEVVVEPGTRYPVGTFDTVLSKTRSVLVPGEIRGRASLQLVLPRGSILDEAVAVSCLHDAQSAVALHNWSEASVQGLSAIFVLQRRFLPDFYEPWAEDHRAHLVFAYEQALSCYGEASLHLGPTELPAAERNARRLIELDPLAETGYCLLMRALAARGDRAAAVGIYDRLRRTVDEELGVSPGAHARSILQELLGARGTSQTT
jgi:DNA-binding SARP family transcriptional activator